MYSNFTLVAWLAHQGEDHELDWPRNGDGQDYKNRANNTTTSGGGGGAT